MLFHSPIFFIFLPIVFIIYWFVFNKNLKLQNLFIVIASYMFYGWWDWRFLILIFLSSLADFIIGIKIARTEINKKRKILLITSLVINLVMLGFFKYFNFFISSLYLVFSSIGIDLHITSLNIILPIGISFYTFQTLSYTIDVYKKKIEPTNDPIVFFAFVSFFPQLVAGPIERASNLLPQFLKKRFFDYETARDGIKQILWGFFKKLVIADTCAIFTNEIFKNYESLNGSVLLLGAIYFAFQIYGDFSGYSDIAIGLSKLFGFSLMQNFNLPYFSRNIAEFWKRWHISLSSWFKDYVYIPLGGSFCSKTKQIKNIIITFTLSGLWHGANWTFIFWGFLNGLYYIPGILKGDKIKYKTIAAENKIFPSLKEIFQIFTTFVAVLIGWIFFRSENLTKAFKYIYYMFSKELFSIPNSYSSRIFIILLLIIIEWIQRKKRHPLEINNLPLILRWGIYTLIIILIIFTTDFHRPEEFIYFQF